MEGSRRQNYELFSLVKLLSIRTEEGKALKRRKSTLREIKDVISSRASFYKEAITSDNKKEKTLKIKFATVGGYSENAFIALALSNDYLIFRWVGEDGVPIVRTFRWFKENSKSICAMCFNPTAQWLLCITTEAILVLIPIYFLMNRKNLPFPESDTRSKEGKAKKKFSAFASLNDISCIRMSGKNKLPISQVVWWKTSTGEDYAVLSSMQGTLSFVNLSTHEETVIKLKYPVVRMEMIIGPNQSYKYLLLSTHQGGYWSLVLEQINGEQSATILANQTKEAFQPVQLKFAPETVVRSQQTRTGSSLGSLDPTTSKYEIHGAEPSKFPLFLYQLLPQTEHVLHTPKFTFAIKHDEEGAHIYAVSNAMATVGRTSTPLDPVFQEFVMPGEKIRGYFGAFQRWDEQDRSSAKPRSDTTEVILEGGLLYTHTAMYEIRPKTHPEQIFLELLWEGKEKTLAEPFGKAVGLDILRLYEEAADKYFWEGWHGRALDIYYLSNVDVGKLVYNYLSIGRMDVVYSHLNSVLYQPRTLAAKEKKRFSTLLFACYVYKYLEHQPFVNEPEFVSFIYKNADYDETKALSLLLDHGLIRYFLMVAHARNQVHGALKMMVNNGYTALMHEEVNFLVEHGYSLHLKSCRPLFSSLPVYQQINLLLDDPATVPRFFKRIKEAIIVLKQPQLLMLAEFFNPEGNTKFESRRSLSDAEEDEYPSSPEEYVELFLEILLCLIHRRQNSPEESHTNLKDQELSSQLLDNTPTVLDVKLSCGWNHAGAIISIADASSKSKKEQKCLLTWGSNEEGQLGHNTKVRYYFEPTPVQVFAEKRITSIACGGEHSVFIENSIAIYTCGKGERGQLGHGDKLSRICPHKIEFSPKSPFYMVGVAHVAAGNAFTLVLLNDGHLMGCGACDQGQLGIGTRNDELSFVKIQVSQSPITNISCGFGHTLCYTKAGEFFSWGNGMYGQLGHHSWNDEESPKLIVALANKKIEYIDCGSFHSAAITNDGEVYTWGRGSRFRLGHRDNNNVCVPKLVASLQGKKITKIACGYNHTIASADNGNVYSWGCGENGMLGLRDDQDRDEPTLVTTVEGKILQIGCGQVFSVVATDSASLYVWGSSQQGQLGLGDTKMQTQPQILANLVQYYFKDQIQSKQTQSLLKTLESCDFQGLLERTLRNQHNHYRVNVLLLKCNEWQNWRAAAIVHELQGTWIQALECRFMDIEGSEIVNDQSVLELMTMYLSKSAKEETSIILVDKILRFWNMKKLPLAPLEEYIVNNLENYHLPRLLCKVLEDTSRTWVIEFSPQVYLTVVKTYLNSTKRNSDHTQDTNQIREYSKLILPRSIISEESPSQHIAFTCGHFFEKKLFYERELPQFKHKMETELPVKIPVTAKILFADYHQSFVNLACPDCVFKELLREQKKVVTK